MEEPEVVNAIRKYIEKLPDVTKVSGEMAFIKNGCVSDVVGFSNNKIKYIVECKGSGSPGNIAGGIGQAYQYAYQKSFNSIVAEDSEVYFACPEDRKEFLEVMQIPKEVKKILLVKDNKEIYIFKKSKKNGIENILQIEGTTYLEATTIELITKSIEVLFNLKKEERNKSSFLKIMKEKYPKITDHRNTLITPKGLGLVTNYSLTPKGYYFYGLLKKDKLEFKKELINLLYPSLIVIINAFIIFIKNTDQKLNSFKFTSKDIEKEIKNIYGGEVNFFDYRRLSYGIKILKEIGVLEKIENSKNYKINKITNFT